jgi:hypothetical protein
MMPSDDEWYRAVAAVRENYGEDIFPPERRLISTDCASAYLARSVCDQIVKLARGVQHAANRTY